jgi:hypothetical protein
MIEWNNDILINQIDKDPKDIFSSYCNELGNYYSTKDFKYYKSRPRVERTNGDIIESINFWSSRFNDRNESVNLEILPFVKSKSLKKWIKLNSIGRNEFIYSLQLKGFRNRNIFGHSLRDFNNLTQEIDHQVLIKLEEFKTALLDLNSLLDTDKYDDGIIPDNFLAYLCMSDISLIDAGLNKFEGKLNEEKKEKILMFKESSS